MNKYVIMPVDLLPKNLPGVPMDGFTENEIAAMCTSAQMEIIKGDTGEKSLNVKLYKCLSPYLKETMDIIIDG